MPYSIIKKIDFFGHPPSLYIKKKTSYPTLIGGIMSSILFVVTIGLIVFYGRELFLRKKPTLMTATQHIGSSQIKLNRSNMFIGFVMFAANKSAFNFDVNWFFYSFKIEKQNDIIKNNKSNEENEFFPTNNETIEENNTETSTDDIVLKGINCTMDMLANFEDITNETKTIIVEHGVCIDFNNENISASANFNNQLSRILVEMNYNLSLVFENPYVLEEYEKSFPLSLHIFYQSNIYDPENFEHPNKKTLGSTSLSFESSTLHQIQAEIKAINSITKTGFFFSSTESKKETALGLINVFDVESGMVFSGNGYGRLFDMRIALNQELNTNIREYKTLIDFFSELGGVLNLLLIFFRIIMVYVGDFEILFYLFTTYHAHNCKEGKNIQTINTLSKLSNLNDTKGKNQSSIAFNENVSKSIGYLNEMTPKSPVKCKIKNNEPKYTRWKIIKNHFIPIKAKKLLPIDPICFIKEALEVEKIIEMKEEYKLLKCMVLSKENYMKLKQTNKLALRIRNEDFIDSNSFLLKEHSESSSYLTNNYIERNCSIKK